MKSIKAVVALALTMFVAVASPAQDNGPSNPARALPKLVIDSPSHDFGEIKAGTPMRHSFKVRNEGKGDLKILSVVPSCGCTKGDYDQVIAPGKEGKIELVVERTEGYSGEVAKTASVTTNDVASPTINLTIRARFKVEHKPGQSAIVAPIKMKTGPFQVEPSPRWITSAITGSTSASTISLYNPEESAVRIKEVQPGGTDFTVQLQTLQDGKRYQLVVATTSALKPGSYRQIVRVVTDNPKTPVAEIQLEATVFPRVFATPNSIVMPTLPHDAPDLKTITWPMIYVRKIREGGLKINKYSTDVPFLKLDLVTEREGEVYAIRLTLDQSKIKAGGFQGKIHIETNDAEMPVIDIPIRGTFN